MNERILFVDDDPNILEAYERKLQKVLRVETALGAVAGLRAVVEKGPFAVVIADMHMPVMNGIEFLRRVKEEAPDTVRMMLTGNADVNVAIQAVNEGSVFRFLTKPCPAEVLGKALVDGINQYRLVTGEKDVLESTLNGVVELLGEILSWVAPEAFGRTVHLRHQVKAMAKKLRVEDVWELELAATLSQIGYMAVPQEVLSKAAAGETLTEDEQAALTGVPAIGQELVARIPRLENVARIILYQDKRFDGGGFPKDDVAGAQIPLGARILKVLLDLQRLEAQGISRWAAMSRAIQQEGCYDPRVLAAACELYGGRGPAPVVPEVQAIEIGLRDLRPGLTLVEDIETLDGRLLVRSGAVLTEALWLRVKKFAALKGVREPIAVRRPPES